MLMVYILCEYIYYFLLHNLLSIKDEETEKEIEHQHFESLEFKSLPKLEAESIIYKPVYNIQMLFNQKDIGNFQEFYSTLLNKFSNDAEGDDMFVLLFFDRYEIGDVYKIQKSKKKKTILVIQCSKATPSKIEEFKDCEMIVLNVTPKFTAIEVDLNNKFFF